MSEKLFPRSTVLRRLVKAAAYVLKNDSKEVQITIEAALLLTAAYNKGHEVTIAYQDDYIPVAKRVFPGSIVIKCLTEAERHAAEEDYEGVQVELECALFLTASFNQGRDVVAIYQDTILSARENT